MIRRFDMVLLYAVSMPCRFISLLLRRHDFFFMAHDALCRHDATLYVAAC